MKSQIRIAASQPTQTAIIPAGGILQRKCACGGTPGPTGECAECKRKRLDRMTSGRALQPKLVVNQPGDKYEQEADRVAEAVVSVAASNRPSISSLGSGNAVQREDPAKPKTEEEKYKEAAKKVGEAFLETPPGKEIKKKAEELGDAFVSTLPGKVITGAAVAGAIATLAATHKELPIGIPEIPLDKIKPSLKMKITYEGPVDKPTKVMATFSFPLPGGKAREKKPALTESEKFRAETARIAAEQAQFREGLKSEEEKAAEKRMFDAYFRSKVLAPGQLTPRTPRMSFGVGGEQLGFHPGVPSSGTRSSLSPGAPDFKLTGETQAEEPKKKEEESLQRKSANDHEVSAAPPIVDEVLQSSGQPLDAETRAFMEPRFGHDFSRVRVHTDTHASESARSMQACAYTTGQHVVFAANEYKPATLAGRHLLAHELAHVMQQSVGHSAGIVQRRSVFQSIGIFFGLTEGDFSDQELHGFLSKITKSNKIEDSFDSDNKARAIVRRWKSGDPAFAIINAPQKVLLIREMLSGVFSGDDENSVLDLLENSVNSDLGQILAPGGIDAKALDARFGKVGRTRFEAFLDRRFEGGKKAVLAGDLKPAGKPLGSAEVKARLNQLTVLLAGLKKQADRLQDEFIEAKATETERKSQAEAITGAKKGALYDAVKADVPPEQVEMLKRVIRVEEGANQIKLVPSMQITYLSLPEIEGRTKAAIDIPRAIAKIQEVTSVAITQGYYGGIAFSIVPKIAFRPPAVSADPNSWQINVRGPGPDDSSSGAHGVIDLAPGHLEGDRIIVVAHEMLHLFGPGRVLGVLTDKYLSMTSGKPPKTRRTVGRSDPQGRADLLGMVDPVFLENWLKAGEITQEQYKLQTEGKPKLFEEDATVILKAMSILRPDVKPSFDPENDDPEERLREVGTAKGEALAKVRERKKGVENSLQWLDTVEAIKKVEGEIAALRAQLPASSGGVSPATGQP